MPTTAQIIVGGKSQATQQKTATVTTPLLIAAVVAIVGLFVWLLARKN